MLSRLIPAGALALLVWTGLAAAQTVPVPRGRLPDTVRPVAYRLKLTVDPSRSRFYGHAEIDVQVTQPVQVVYLHALGLRMRRVDVEIPGPEEETTLYVSHKQVGDGIMRLDVPLSLGPGDAKFIFDYTAPFRTTPEGLFHAKVGGQWYAWTQLEPIDARRVFPCFDQPGFKTPFTVTVKAPRSAKVFSNAPEVQTLHAWFGKTIHRFAPTKPLPTYLVAIAVGPFDVLETTVPPDGVRSRPLPFRIIATRGQKSRMQVALTEGPKLLALLERYMGMPYPYEKLDLAASPVQSGAMENAGLILFEDPEILLDPDARLSQLREFGTVAAHEMAHQWFGDLVTPTWWTDIWLNESFAEWMGNKIAAEWRPDLDIPATQVAHAFAAMDSDALGHARPIRQEITDSSQIASTFDDITYLKGAQVLSMFESFLGPEKLQKAVRQYLKSHPYGNASAEDFFRALASAAGDPRIVAAMHSFIEQTGVPVISVHDEPDGLSLAQAPYHPLGVSPPGPRLWSIPVCLARGQARSCTLLTKASATVAAVPGEGYLVPNAGGAGYYRFRLDDVAWSRLIAASGLLPAPEALAVGDSLWADFTAGTGTLARVIAGARELAEQPDTLAATELARPLEELSRSVLTADELPGYQRIMGSIYGLRLTELGINVKRGAYAAEPAHTQLLRQSLVRLVALEARDRALRLRLANAAQSSLDGARDALDTGFRRTAFSVAAQDRGVPFMRQLKEALVKSRDPQFRADAIAALGSADTPTLTAAALQLAYSQGLQPTETLSIIASLTLQPGARSTAISYINANFERVLQLTPRFERPELVDVLFDDDCAAGDVAKVDDWARRWGKSLGGGDLEIAQAKERIGRCVALKQAKAQEIAATLEVPLVPMAQPAS